MVKEKYFQYLGIFLIIYFGLLSFSGLSIIITNLEHWKYWGPFEILNLIFLSFYIFSVYCSFLIMKRKTGSFIPLIIISLIDIFKLFMLWGFTIEIKPFMLWGFTNDYLIKAIITRIDYIIKIFVLIFLVTGFRYLKDLKKGIKFPSIFTFYFKPNKFFRRILENKISMKYLIKKYILFWIIILLCPFVMRIIYDEVHMLRGIYFFLGIFIALIFLVFTLLHYILFKNIQKISLLYKVILSFVTNIFLIWFILDVIILFLLENYNVFIGGSFILLLFVLTVYGAVILFKGLNRLYHKKTIRSIIAIIIFYFIIIFIRIILIEKIGGTLLFQLYPI